MRKTGKAGEIYDKNNIPIYPGDLLKSFHFMGRRRKRYYLYHVAVEREDGYMEMVPVHELGLPPSGGRVWLDQQYGDTVEIIAGHGPDQCICFDERPRNMGRKNETRNDIECKEN